jgi:hypothetical protein
MKEVVYGECGIERTLPLQKDDLSGSIDNDENIQP